MKRYKLCLFILILLTFFLFFNQTTPSENNLKGGTEEKKLPIKNTKNKIYYWIIGGIILIIGAGIIYKNTIKDITENTVDPLLDPSNVSSIDIGNNDNDNDNILSKEDIEINRLIDESNGIFTRDNDDDGLVPKYK